MKLKKFLENIPAKYLFRLSYLANHFRDPFLRQCEQELGLTRPEASILFCLASQDGITAKDVADVTRQPKNTLSRGSLILEGKGLITREKRPERPAAKQAPHYRKRGRALPGAYTAHLRRE